MGVGELVLGKTGDSSPPATSSPAVRVDTLSLNCGSQSFHSVTWIQQSDFTHALPVLNL